MLRRAELLLADGQAAGLNVLVARANGVGLWIECRTDAYQDRLDRDVRLRRALGLEPMDALIVLAGVTPAACVELSALHGLDIITPDLLDDALRAALEARSISPTPTPAVRKLTPEPETGPFIRPPTDADSPTPPMIPADVDRILTLSVASTPSPISWRSLRAPPRRRRSSCGSASPTAPGSRAQPAADLLVALARGGALLGSDGAPVARLGDPVAALASNDPVVLDALPAGLAGQHFCAGSDDAHHG